MTPTDSGFALANDMDDREPAHAHLPVPAIGRAFEVMDLLAHSDGPCSLRDIHTRLDLPKTSVYSILATLQACGAVVKLRNGTYRPGIRLYTLGMSVRVTLEHSKIFLPRLRQLRDAIGHTVFFSLFDDGDLVVWEKVEGLESVYFKAYVGERKRLNTSSAGKAIAAYLTEEELNYALSKGMDSLTERSITSREEFLRHLRETREKGYAIDDEEGERGIFCIGVPVFNRQGQVFGAVSMSTLKSRIHVGSLNGYINELKRAADDLSRIL